MAINFKKTLGSLIIFAAVFSLTFQARAADTVAPHAPTDLAAVAGDGQVILSWINPADSDFRHMRIYRSTISGVIGDYFATNITGTTYIDTTAVNGITYYYNVRPVDSSANINTNTFQVWAAPAAAAAAVPVIINTSAEKSTVEVFPKAIAADGVQTSDIIVTIKDADGNPLPDKTVTVYSSRGINDIIPVSTKQTGANGVAMFEIKSSLVGYATITAMNGDIQLVQTGVVTIIPVPPVTTPVPIKTFVAGGLYRASGDTKVYIIENNAKRWIKTAEEFNAAGYKWNKISETNSVALAAYPDAAVSAARVKISTSALRVRSVNSTAGAVMGHVLQGEIYAAIEEKSGWYKIQTSGGVIGWIMGSYTVKL